MNPPIRQFMSKVPVTIGRHQTMAMAHELMRSHSIRHLPVLDAGALVGVVSVGDLHLVETLKDVDPKAVLVEEAMSDKPYAVAPTEALGTVAESMARRKCGSAVIVDRGRVVGVFTTVDALRALAALSRRAKAKRRVSKSAKPAAVAKKSSGARRR